MSRGIGKTQEAVLDLLRTEPFGKGSGVPVGWFRDHVDAPPSSVNRAVRGLEERGLVTTERLGYADLAWRSFDKRSVWDEVTQRWNTIDEWRDNGPYAVYARSKGKGHTPKWVTLVW